MRHPPGPRRSPAHRTPLALLSVFLLYVLLPPAPAPPGGSAVPAGAPAPSPGAVTDTDSGAEGGTGGGADAGTDGGADSDARSWPLAGRPSVLRGWEPPTGPYGPGHRGVDLAAWPGERVLAATDGRVSFAGRVAGRGVVAIEVAGSGSPPLRTTYEPVRALIEQGASTRAGQPVGVLEEGPFHCSDGCLHWGLRRGDAYLDPLSLLPPSLLRRGPSRLLPVFGVPEADAVRVSRSHRAGPSRRRCPR
ncbi:M23 family metallopeptidase [Streptomyces anulatus]|uniref:M23 family metallopeptidase n=1 Tax=Streptomyces anulatus TaxID=1892 RepID=UPI00224EEAA5|nr:M23 family metallopeptidase [Streptomyces anulatus]MCX4502757.1 M23 family metallopeptidase [Streptomyces anulatus]